MLILYVFILPLSTRSEFLQNATSLDLEFSIISSIILTYENLYSPDKVHPVANNENKNNI